MRFASLTPAFTRRGAQERSFFRSNWFFVISTLTQHRSFPTLKTTRRSQALHSTRSPYSIAFSLLSIVFLSLPVSGCLREELSDYISFTGAAGPTEQSLIPPTKDAEWRDYSEGSPSRLAILLLEEESAWIGLVSGLRSLGIPFRITDSIEEAVRHRVVFAYPRISGALLDADDTDTLKRFVENGGTLIATNVLSGAVRDLFGFQDYTESRSRTELVFEDSPLTAILDHPREQRIRLGNPARTESLIGTYSYTDANHVVGRYEDGEAALLEHSFGSGTTYAIGLDLGFYILKARNGRHDGAYRDYINGYEPSVDVLLRLVAAMYARGEPDALRFWGVPDGRDLALIVSHDVDYAGSLGNSPAYAQVESTHGVRATYFMQTKYYQDYFDKVFFDERTEDLLQALDAAGMEIASHSVSHTDLFAEIPVGTGDETYPEYQPRVQSKGKTVGASVLGELRISKYLLEEFSPQRIVSFRPGFLANPSGLAQALQAAGYRYSSAVSSGNALGHLPFQMTYNRGYQGFTEIYEFPVSLEDEKQPPMDRRVEEAVVLAEEIAAYGGVYVVLIHPDITGHKLSFLEAFLPRVREFSWTGTLRSYGEFWASRDTLNLDVTRDEAGSTVRVSGESIPEGLSILLPSDYGSPADEFFGARIEGHRMVLEGFSGSREFRFLRDSRD